MFNVAVVGAGQLGSRHLQGLKISASPMSIYVVDNSEASLETAWIRYDSVPAIGEKSAFFINDIRELPDELDLAIVATGSKPRAGVVRSLLEGRVVRRLILEKVLFPRIREYDEIDSLLKEKQVRCWVNCNKRMFGVYQQVSAELDRSKPIVMSMSGENWGLCCNSIHLIDLFCHLTGDYSFTVDTGGLDERIVDSKREGYIEMTGTLKITTESGNSLSLTSTSPFAGRSGVCIDNGGKSFFLDEAKGYGLICGKETHFRIPYQSQITGVLADSLLISDFCPLTPYGESAHYHRQFIEPLLGFYNRVRGSEEYTDLLPIT